MKGTVASGSLYYVSDKNIFDALSQSKVDNETVRKMFERRNIICSKKTEREELAKYFSLLTHDYFDHQDIAARLGVTSRRERVTSLDIKSPLEVEQIDSAINGLVDSLKKEGDVVHLRKDNGSLVINIKYTECDYRRSEFNQIQQRDGLIELLKVGNEYVVRSTQSGHINAARDDLILRLQQPEKEKIVTSSVSLFEFPDPIARSKFFYDLIDSLEGYTRKDVMEVYLYKVGSGVPVFEDEADSEDEDQVDGNVQKVLMKGSAVARSILLGDLLKDKKYYIFRIGWLAVEKLGNGYGFDVEALFNDAENCLGFSYVVKGVHVLNDDGKLNKKRRNPMRLESDAVAKAIENSARKLMLSMVKLVEKEPEKTPS